MIIKLRNKTEAHLSKLFGARKVSVLEYIETFMEFPEGKAFSELVKIKVSPERILEKNKVLDGITTETLQKIYGDLVANYKAYHPDCWLNRDFEGYPEYLRKALDNDKTMISLVEKRIKNRFESGFILDVDRLHFLLKSHEEKFRFGGLKELWFTHEEAAFFKECSHLIDQYICELYSSEDEVKTVHIPSEEVSADFSEAPVIQEKESEEKLESIEIPTVRDSISAVEIINNAAEIKRFLLVCDELKAVGFEPENVLKDAEKITALLSAAANL